MIRTLPALLALVTVGVAHVQAQDSGFAYINSKEILASLPGAADAERTYAQEVRGFTAEAQRLQDELLRMRTQLEQQALTLSAEARATRERELQARAQQIQARIMEMDQQSQRRRQELLQPVMTRVNGIIEAIRSERSYAVILDVAAGSIVAADPALDLTQEVIRRMRATP